MASLTLPEAWEGITPAHGPYYGELQGADLSSLPPPEQCYDCFTRSHCTGPPVFGFPLTQEKKGCQELFLKFRSSGRVIPSGLSWACKNNPSLLPQLF